MVWDSFIFGCQWKIYATDVPASDVLQVHGKSRIDEQYDEDAAGDRPPGASPWLRYDRYVEIVHGSGSSLSRTRNLHLLESSAFSAFALEEEQLEDQKLGSDENSWVFLWI